MAITSRMSCLSHVACEAFGVRSSLPLFGKSPMFRPNHESSIADERMWVVEASPRRASRRTELSRSVGADSPDP